MHKYTDEQRKFIENNCKNRTSMQLSELFNKHFKTNITAKQIQIYKKNHKLVSGIGSKFKKGQEAWNKGKKGYMGANSTSFKKGDIPANYRPVGSERIDKKDGYTLIKVKDPRTWKRKHVVLWEEKHGKLKKGHVVIFGDGDKSNFDIDNLLCVSRAQLATLNSKSMIQKSAELTKVAINIVNLQHKINKRKRGENK